MVLYGFSRLPRLPRDNRVYRWGVVTLARRFGKPWTQLDRHLSLSGKKNRSPPRRFNPTTLGNPNPIIRSLVALPPWPTHPPPPPPPAAASCSAPMIGFTPRLTSGASCGSSSRCRGSRRLLHRRQRTRKWRMDGWRPVSPRRSRRCRRRRRRWLLLR